MAPINSGDFNLFPAYGLQLPGGPLSSRMTGRGSSLVGAVLGMDDPDRMFEGDGPALFEFDDHSIPHWRLYAMRFFAVIPIALAGILFYDAILAKSVPDLAVVTDLRSDYNNSGRMSVSHKVVAIGSRDYSKSVSGDFYRRLKTGDKLRLETTPILGRWRDAAIVRSGNRVAEYRSKEPIFWGVLACILVVVPAISFAEPHVILRHKGMQHAIVAVEVLAVCGCLFLGMQLAGIG